MKNKLDLTVGILKFKIIALERQLDEQDFIIAMLEGSNKRKQEIIDKVSK